MITWDLGRRCNYDCTYCESTRHDNHSNYVNLDDLKNTFNFIKQWTNLYNNKRSNGNSTSINFTGGEPTISPNFWELVDYIKLSNGNYNLGLTTNGSWGSSYSEKIIKEFNGVTISYHAEADEKFKKRVIENIIRLSKSNIWLQVNVMLHVDHWQECVDVCEMLKSKGIKHNPRPIGDGNIERKGWFIDTDGSTRRTSHTYNADQKQWFFNYLGIEDQTDGRSQGTELGRGCCGGRCLKGKVNDQWQDINIVDTNFKDWYCMVDWYFLHVDQHTKLVYHHQTCQALHNKQRGALGTLDDSTTLLQDLKKRLENPTPIICPNQRCGCGMCVPKAKNQEDFNDIWNSNIKSSSY